MHSPRMCQGWGPDRTALLLPILLTSSRQLTPIQEPTRSPGSSSARSQHTQHPPHPDRGGVDFCAARHRGPSCPLRAEEPSGAQELLFPLTPLENLSGFVRC